MTQTIHLHGLDIAQSLAELLALEISPGTGISPDHFWKHFSQTLDEFMPRNKALLQERDHFQTLIDEYYKKRVADQLPALDRDDQYHFLKDIGYIQPEPEDFEIETQPIDPEISTIAGPQLVVPVMNPRYALNAANARWVSLYDALYGTDVISEADGAEKVGDYNPVRGQKVIEYATACLDEWLALETGSHGDVQSYALDEVKGVMRLNIHLNDGTQTQLKTPELFKGYKEDLELLFVHHNLHIIIKVDHTSRIGQHHPAGVKDIVLESAVTTIQDCEDSVAAVDAEDKTIVYRNWLGLMQGSLEEKFQKNNKIVHRTLAHDYFFTGVTGESLQLPGRSLMLVRNVGLLMNTLSVQKNGEAIPEGILDAYITAFCALHDLKNLSQIQNSKTGSLYIVKPKLHGPQEVKFTVDLFAQVEECLGLEKNTLKIGIMDEERRTTLNLKSAIYNAKERVIFINTGFLDRTGDEIHTSFYAGPMVRKLDMKQQQWISDYEDWNVKVGLQCGLAGKAQIGKGMWAKPDHLADMVKTKIEHPLAGANCAWVPSPTAACLHSIHYHQVLVQEIQAKRKLETPTSMLGLLAVPLGESKGWSKAEIQEELENNAQGILGYVVRWIQDGIGCSKVPDIHNVGLMEDRATLRISSQHIANWLFHKVCTEEQVMKAMSKMAGVVDLQNQNDKSYRAMGPSFQESIAFKAACDLVFKGKDQPNGYTEVILHKKRIEYKAALANH